MNSHTEFQQNFLKLLMNYNGRYDADMNDNLRNGDVSSGIGLINSQAIPQFNESIK